MKKTLLLALLLGASATSTHAITWVTNPGNGHEYALTDSAMSFGSAESLAVSLGGHLASIHSVAENDWIRANLTTGTVWIGLTDAVTEGTYVWTSGEAFSFSFWSSGEPNNQGNEDAVHMNWGAGGRWNDIGIDASYYGILERVPSGVPDAAGMSSLLMAGVALAGASRRFGRR